MNKAERFVDRLMAWVKVEANYSKTEAKTKSGIVTIQFDDGSYADFTEPHAFDKDGNDLTERSCVCAGCTSS